MSTFSCSNCGTVTDGAPPQKQYPPSHWQQLRLGFFSLKYFCSSKCKDEWRARNNK